jgi:hypothetical protein
LKPDNPFAKCTVRLPLTAAHASFENRNTGREKKKSGDLQTIQGSAALFIHRYIDGEL